MSEKLITTLVTVITAIIIVAILAVIVRRGSATTRAIDSASSGFAYILQKAVSPVSVSPISFT